MDYIIHRVNSLEKLTKLSKNHGVEIDVVYDNKQLVLKHSPYEETEKILTLKNFLDEYSNQKLIINVKTSGIEEKIIELTRKYTDNFLLLDVEFPFIIKNYKKYGRYLMLRVSKFESIHNIDHFNEYIKWIWLDTYEELEFQQDYKDQLNTFNICLVSIERWFPEYKITNFINGIEKLNLNIQAVLTDNEAVKDWINYYKS